MIDKFKILKNFEKTLMYLQDILSSNNTDNIQLQNIGAYLFNSGKKKPFIGVFPADKMPILKNNEMCIVNTDDKAGIHWIGCYKYKNKTYCYDSFDRDVKSLSPHWKNKHNWVNANTDRDQSYSSSSCGPFSLAWLIFAQAHTPLKIMSII